MIELLIILMYIAVAAILCVTLWSVYHTVNIVGKTSGISNGINVRKICIAVRTGMFVMLVLSFALASTEPIDIGVTKYGDSFWLRMSNMLVFTGCMAIALAGGAALYSFYLNMKADDKIIK
ncbi:MAG: hypothetical protein IJY03_01155 [Prevotella sp.]|nr:hypothetical protein [Prevotella sp.]